MTTEAATVHTSTLATGLSILDEMSSASPQ